jgi:phage baseplate assembly protein gpV
MNFMETVFGEQNEQRRERRIHGVLTAKVTGRMADGLYELSYLGMGQNAPSAPARMMMPMTGGKRGTYFMPEVGDEVVVAFDSGDTNMPIILGGVWNNDNRPPDQAKPSADNNIRTIVSRSGHEITLDDTAAAQQVHIKTQGGHEVILDDTAPGKVTIHSRGGCKVELDDATMTVAIVAPVKIDLQAAALNIGAGAVTMGPPTALPTPPPPMPTAVSSQVMVRMEAPLIHLKAASIILETTGAPTTSAVIIDGVPFGLHHHVAGAPITGPVAP